MLFEPTLIVREVAIYRGSHYAYRGSFRNGVNIISGENSSGKSSILSLIVYGLGADISSWSEHAKLCDRVSVEVDLNGRAATVSRLISGQSGQAMEIFAGSLEEAERAGVEQWLRYPYRTSTSRQSFSQALFHLLNIPELETETSGKLTIHQLLRVMYSDQLSSVEKIFRDDNFDTPALREAVGRLLFGAYESEIYANQLQIREYEKELSIIEGSLRSIYTLLSGVGHSLTLEWVDAERRNIEHSIERVNADITREESALYSDGAVDDISLSPQQQYFAEAARLQSLISSAEEAEAALHLEQTDSAIFIATLDRKIDALQNSGKIASSVSEIQYAFCPSCFAPLSVEENPHACRLCKEPFDEARMRRRIVNQLNEMVIQQKQSHTLQAARTEELRLLRERKSELVAQWEAARAELIRVRQSPTSQAREQLRKLNERAGYLRRELEGLNEKASLIGRLDQMSRQKSDLTGAIEGLRDKNERLKFSEADRLSRAYEKVADETVYFLHRDLPRQDSFQNAKTVHFSFGRDNISVDGQSYFSASSTVYLKNAFLSAFLFSAAQDQQFRHLRFLVLDTIEDKGMEPERSQNFQRLLVDRSSQIDNEHQIIFATAMINPELDNEQYVVGRRSTHDNRTLNIN